MNETQLELIEPIIRKTAWKYHSRLIPYEDMCQELRLAMWLELKKFDESKGKFTSFVKYRCHMRAIELCRVRGELVRWSGKKRHRLMESIDVPSFYTDDQHPLDSWSEDETDWADLQEYVFSKGNQELQIKFLRFSGVKQREIAKRFGVTPSRVHQVEHSENSMERLIHLAGVTV